MLVTLSQIILFFFAGSSHTECKVAHEPQEAHSGGPEPGLCSMKQLGVLLPPPDGMLVHHRVTNSILSPVPFLYTWAERHNVE